jgi:MOSC domain-containing protein YiiM
VAVNENGIVGDAHAGNWHRQVSLLAGESIEQFSADYGAAIGPEQFAENITTGGINLARAAILDRFAVGGAELEVTQIGKKCHGSSCSVYREVGNCIMPNEGIFCRVASPGTIAAGDKIEHRKRPLLLYVYTLSDRACAGEYEDRSGPAACRILENTFGPTRWHWQIRSRIMPDDPTRLRQALA